MSDTNQHSEPVDIATTEDAYALIRGTAIGMRQQGFDKSADILDASLKYLEEQFETQAALLADMAQALDPNRWRTHAELRARYDALSASTPATSLPEYLELEGTLADGLDDEPTVKFEGAHNISGPGAAVLIPASSQEEDR